MIRGMNLSSNKIISVLVSQDGTAMREKLVRINSSDGIEMPGILYTPEDGSDKIIIHVHGINGNFYENKFLDYIAEAYTDHGYAFVTFDNRGKGYASDRYMGNELIYTGAMYERFADSLLDLDGMVSWSKENGYKEIILHGHSYGCNKVLYYYAKRKDPVIKRIMILSPCDVPGLLKSIAPAEVYKKAVSEADRLIALGKADELISFPFFATGKVSAGTFSADFFTGGENDFLCYRKGIEYDCDLLKEIDVPVFACFGNLDELVLSQPEEIVRGYLKHNIKDIEISVIDGANHGFHERCEELKTVVNRVVEAF